MSEVSESGEESIDESGRNPTQRRIDEEGEEGATDVAWEDERFGELPDGVDRDENGAEGKS
jgi:hypothetical protein